MHYLHFYSRVWDNRSLNSHLQFSVDWRYVGFSVTVGDLLEIWTFNESSPIWNEIYYLFLRRFVYMYMQYENFPSEKPNRISSKVYFFNKIGVLNFQWSHTQFAQYINLFCFLNLNYISQAIIHQP